MLPSRVWPVGFGSDLDWYALDHLHPSGVEGRQDVRIVGILPSKRLFVARDIAAIQRSQHVGNLRGVLGACGLRVDRLLTTGAPADKRADIRRQVGRVRLRLSARHCRDQDNKCERCGNRCWLRHQRRAS